MNTRSVLRSGGVGILVLLLSLQAQAQVSPHDWGRVESLASGSEIFVKTKAGEKRTGALSQATDKELIFYAYQRGLSRDRYRLVLNRADIQEVRMVARELSGIVGAGIGAGVGAALGAGIDTASARDHEFRSTMTVLFGLIGAGFGRVLGRSTGFIKGEKLYVAP